MTVSGLGLHDSILKIKIFKNENFYGKDYLCIRTSLSSL